MKISPLAAAIALTLYAAGASAANWDDRINVRGYGTLGVVHSDEDQADFVTMPRAQPEGAGYTDAWSTDVDSRVGLQVDIQLTERLSGVAQLVSEAVSNNSWNGDPNESYVPSLEWANLSYKVSDDFTVRGGRIVLPFLSIAEFRKVGFAQHWVRPPVELYGLIPFASSDGVDLSHRTSLAGGFNTARVHYGYQSSRNATGNSQAEIWGVNDTFEHGALTLRAAYMHVFFDTPGPCFAPLFDTFVGLSGPGAAGQAAAAVARQLQNQFDPSGGQEIDLYSVGVGYDPGRWFALSEMMRAESDGLVGSNYAGFVSGGYRFGSFSPYATYSRVSIDDRSGKYGVPLAGLSPPAAGVGRAINNIIGTFTSDDGSQQTYAVGLRWDFHRNFTLKTQYDHVAPDAGGAGQLQNVQPGYELGGSVNVFSIAVDYVF